ncbi:retinol dehydrogenase 11 isoform X5 [Leguminivora glycinivorella]|uniref:retinol dehydrogenase 11 isoform X5 n=1 Tax=Leguminivora glycinivorella TaxID=1035111 RepID=UPI00200FED6C|nr:retinol dehydrogenase 11 isoform X5 [Leguminivora glycinivorella]
MAFTLAAFALLAALYLYRIYHKSTNGICTTLKTLEGKTAIVTGGTTGMGLEIAKDFTRRGARVIIACPFEEEGLNAQKIIQEKTGVKPVFKLLDLGSLESVRSFAGDILKTEDRLDLLINNAGVGVPKNFETNDGMNFIMQVNYYGHFLLTILLLPLLKKTGTAFEPARVVNTSSMLHVFGRVDLNTSKSGINWLPFISYCNSKFSMIPFSRELTRRLKGAHVVINSVDPGAVGTGIYYSGGLLFGAVLRYWTIFFNKTPKEGAQTALHVALDVRTGQTSGEFFKDCQQARAIPTAYRYKTSKVLWEESVRLVRLTEEELDKCLN